MSNLLYRWRLFRKRRCRRKLLERMVRHCTRSGHYQAATLFLEDLQRLRDEIYEEAKRSHV